MKYLIFILSSLFIFSGIHAQVYVHTIITLENRKPYTITQSLKNPVEIYLEYYEAEESKKSFMKFFVSPEKDLIVKQKFKGKAIVSTQYLTIPDKGKWHRITLNPRSKKNIGERNAFTCRLDQTSMHKPSYQFYIFQSLN